MGQIEWHVAVEDAAAPHVVSLVTRWEQLEQGPRFTKWKGTDQLVLCMTSEIVAALIWTESDGIITVLLPLGLRV